jgi:hypothetical protein
MELSIASVNNLFRFSGIRISQRRFVPVGSVRQGAFCLREGALSSYELHIPFNTVVVNRDHVERAAHSFAAFCSYKTGVKQEILATDEPDFDEFFINTSASQNRNYSIQWI